MRFILFILMVLGATLAAAYGGNRLVAAAQRRNRIMCAIFGVMWLLPILMAMCRVILVSVQMW